MGGPQPDGAPGAARMKLIGFRILMLGLMVLVFAGSRAWGKLETRRWPRAEATVLFSDVVERTGKTHDWCVQVGYRYSVDSGRQGGAKRWGCSASRAGAEAKLAQMPEGRRIQIYVDPAHPERSQLEAASLDSLDGLSGIVAVILIAVGVDRMRHARHMAAVV